MTLKERFDHFAREAGLCNAKGEYPAVVSVLPDPNNKVAQIITVQGGGLSLPLPVALNKEVRQLERHLGGEVFDISYGETTAQTQFKFKARGEGRHENL